uniref:Uncharacterized protein n=1 Tax=Oryza nivara TaxID=4536 RepID=A0A0E0GI88_ORYNI
MASPSMLPSKWLPRALALVVPPDGYGDSTIFHIVGRTARGVLMVCAVGVQIRGSKISTIGRTIAIRSYISTIIKIEDVFVGTLEPWRAERAFAHYDVPTVLK